MRYIFLVALTLILNISVAQTQTIDESFQEPVPVRPAKIKSVKVLTDGKILLGGEISFFESTRVNNFIRLNSDGTLDETFDFNGSESLRIQKIELQSTGDIIVLANDINTTNYFLLQLGPDGEIKNEIDTLMTAKSIAVQNDDKILVCGGNYLYRYNNDFSADLAFNETVIVNDIVLDVKVENGKIYICGLFSTCNDIIKNGVVRLNTDGTIDDTFDVGEGTSDRQCSLAIQTDGKILLGGNYINSFNGTPSTGMVRLLPDGNIDPEFSTPYLSNPTSEMTVTDTCIYVSTWIPDGYFLLKLNTDGSLDEGFKPVQIDENGNIDFSLALTDNELIFNNSTTTGCKYGLSMCDWEGNMLNSFAPAVSRYGNITIGDYFDGKFVVAGDFIKINNVETYGIALLDINGLVNESFILPENHGRILQVQVFNDNTIFISTGNSFLKLNNIGEILNDFNFREYTRLNRIVKFKVLPDEKIIAADDWGLYRLNADGTEDTSFNTGTGIDLSSSALDFDLQDDKIIWGSAFNNYNGTAVHKLIRLNSDGSIDAAFNTGTGPDNIVSKTKVLDSGDIIIGGLFLNFNGIDVPNGIVKLSKDGEMDLQFNENQKLSSGEIMYHGFTKIQQIDTIIYIMEDASITALNLDGTIIPDFNIPATIKSINDIVAIKDMVPAGSKKKSSSDLIVKKYLFALGTLEESVGNDPSFIVKFDLENNSTPTQVPDNHFKDNSDFDIKLYPSPVVDKLVISYPGTISNPGYIIYSFNGSRVCASGIHANITEIDMSKYAPGIYFVRITANGNGIYTREIIK